MMSESSEPGRFWLLMTAVIVVVVVVVLDFMLQCHVVEDCKS